MVRSLINCMPRSAPFRPRSAPWSCFTSTALLIGRFPKWWASQNRTWASVSIASSANLRRQLRSLAMDPEKLREAGQSQRGGSQIQIDADALMREVRRNQQSFRATIFWRDFREILAALVVLVAVSLDV